MKSLQPEYLSIKGKTYSLFGDSDSTTGYYETIRMLADKVLAINPNIPYLIETIRKFSSKKRILKKSIIIKDSANQMVTILNLIDPFLKK